MKATYSQGKKKTNQKILNTIKSFAPETPCKHTVCEALCQVNGEQWVHFRIIWRKQYLTHGPGEFFFTEVLGSYRVSLEKSARGYNSAEETLLLVLKRQGGLPVWRESGNRQEVILFQKEKNKLVLNFDQKFWSKVSGWNTSKDGRGTSIQALLNSWKGCLENEKMCLCGETSNSFEVAIKVRCAKKII